MTKDNPEGLIKYDDVLFIKKDGLYHKNGNLLAKRRKPVQANPFLVDYFLERIKELKNS